MTPSVQKEPTAHHHRTHSNLLTHQPDTRTPACPTRPCAPLLHQGHGACLTTLTTANDHLPLIAAVWPSPQPLYIDQSSSAHLLLPVQGSSLIHRFMPWDVADAIQTFRGITQQVRQRVGK